MHDWFPCGPSRSSADRGKGGGVVSENCAVISPGYFLEIRIYQKIEFQFLLSSIQKKELWPESSVDRGNCWANVRAIFGRGSALRREVFGPQRTPGPHVAVILFGCGHVLLTVVSLQLWYCFLALHRGGSLDRLYHQGASAKPSDSTCSRRNHCYTYTVLFAPRWRAIAFWPIGVSADFHHT